MADDTLTIASQLQQNLLIHDLPENPEKPGESPEPGRAVLFGARHPDALHGVGITRGVPAAMFHAWLERHPHLAQFLHEVSDEDLAHHAAAHTQFGFEPALAEALSHPDHQEAFNKGSQITAAHPSAQDMSAVSTGPYDDSPRSQVRRPSPPLPDAPPPPPEEPV